MLSPVDVDDQADTLASQRTSTANGFAEKQPIYWMDSSYMEMKQAPVGASVFRGGKDGGEIISLKVSPPTFLQALAYRHLSKRFRTPIHDVQQAIRQYSCDTLFLSTDRELQPMS
jgi:hypothetical protein